MTKKIKPRGVPKKEEGVTRIFKHQISRAQGPTFSDIVTPLIPSNRELIGMAKNKLKKTLSTTKYKVIDKLKGK